MTSPGQSPRVPGSLAGQESDRESHEIRKREGKGVAGAAFSPQAQSEALYKGNRERHIGAAHRRELHRVANAQAFRNRKAGIDGQEGEIERVLTDF